MVDRKVIDSKAFKHPTNGTAEGQEGDKMGAKKTIIQGLSS